jgi:hypothetical protein
MWLFDNLFLDANTPVTINDWVDHSKDVVQVIVDPQWGASGWSAGDDSSTGGKKDDGFVTLFESDKKEELAAAETLNPEPPKDIALEIGHTTDAMWAWDPSVSFDIWWDMSFDIWWDMSWWNTSVNQPSQIQDLSVPEGITFLNTENTPQQPVSLIDMEAWNTNMPLVWDEWVPKKEEPNTDNALFSLLNAAGESKETDTTAWNPPILFSDSSNETSSIAWVEPQDLQSQNSSLLDLTSENSEPIVPILTSQWVVPSEENIVTSVKQIPGATTPQSSYAWIGELPLSSSTKLKNKLTQFLAELETMEVGDTTQKEHKIQQIEMCKNRIAEIRAEYDARIQALQVEMRALEKEIQDMDGEKTHIKAVIETFQKELGIA